MGATPTAQDQATLNLTEQYIAQVNQALNVGSASRAQAAWQLASNTIAQVGDQTLDEYQQDATALANLQRLISQLANNPQLAGQMQNLSQAAGGAAADQAIKTAASDSAETTPESTSVFDPVYWGDKVASALATGVGGLASS